MTSHPSSCYMTLISEQGSVKICKYSQSPFNHSQSSLFFAPQNWTKLYAKDVDQKRILNPHFEQLFCRMLPRLSISLSISITTMLRCSGSLYIAPTNNEKRKRLVIGNRYIFSKDDHKLNIFQLSSIQR